MKTFKSIHAYVFANTEQRFHSFFGDLLCCWYGQEVLSPSAQAPAAIAVVRANAAIVIGRELLARLAHRAMKDRLALCLGILPNRQSRSLLSAPANARHLNAAKYT